MDRLRRVSTLWNWLPVFRAVAETEHLRHAADRLHISPSALSRTLKLLEDGVGQPLFERSGRRLELNAAGEVLLAAVRDAMRLVHDATELLEEQRLTGTVRISAAGTLTMAFVVPALERLRREHRELVPVLETGGLSDAATSLLSGEIDVTFSSQAVADPELVTEKLGSSTNGVYCGRTHPLRGADEATLESLAAYPFVAPPERNGVSIEGWPVEVPREVGAYVTSLQAGIEVCRSGEFLAVFPDVVAARHVEDGSLWRVPFDELPDVPFFATYRRLLGPPGRTEAVLEAVRAVIAEA